MDTKPRLGLRPCFPSTSIRPSASLTILSIVYWRLSKSIFNGLFDMFLAGLVKINGVVFSLELPIVRETGINFVKTVFEPREDQNFWLYFKIFLSLYFVYTIVYCIAYVRK